MAAVFDLDAGDVVEHLIVAHIDVVAHAHINGGIFNAREDVVLDEAVLTELGEDAVHAGIDDPVIADREVIARLAHDGVAFVVGDLEPLHREAIAAIKDGVVELLLPIEMWPAVALNDAAQCNVVFVDIYRFAVEPRINQNLIARCRAVHRILNAIPFADFDDGRLRH